jgi:hypothetical protein
MATINSSRESNRRRIELVEQKIKQRPAAVTRRDRADLARARRALARPTRAGAPAQTAQFHKWIAAHCFWERAQRGKAGKRILAKVADGKVCKRWGITQTTIVDAVKKHDEVARVLAAMPDIKPVIDDRAAVYRQLAAIDLKAEKPTK